MGSAPDLGAYETSVNTAVPQVTTDKVMSGNVRIRQIMNGMLLVTVDGAPLSDVTTVTVCSLTGQKLAETSFRGASTMLSLPNVSGPAIINIADEVFKVVIR